MKIFTAVILLTLAIIPCSASANFKDVPKDHWAAESVQLMADAGILKGYEDGTYQGDKPVTRYELAVALERMIHFINESRKPLAVEKDKLSLTPPAKHWADASSNFLKVNGFLPKGSPVFSNGSKETTHKELATALASISVRLIELRLPAGSESM